MSFLQSVIGQVVGIALQFLLDCLKHDRRADVLDRRAKVLNLVKEMRAANVTPQQLRQFERRLTDE